MGAAIASRPVRRLRRPSAALALLALTLPVLTLTACSSGGSGSTAAAKAAQSARSAPRSVVVELFEWRFADVARECTDVLGPDGYGAVQISPPQEHVVLPDAGYPWWQQYQPVSYRIAGRLGSRDDLAAMVTTCHAAGVKVYADAVVNHMTGQDAGGVGSGGTTFEHYSYPGLYTPSDFHHCGQNGDDDIADYFDRTEVQTCELVNLADLDTGSPSVRAKIDGYLDDLLSLGVDGFRIDAAKHMAETDVAAIVKGLSRPAFVYQEVIYGSGEPITPEEYLPSGDVLEFRYGTGLSAAFKDGLLDHLSDFGQSGLLPGDKAVVFTDNHDTQRSQADSVLTFRDDQLYRLANAFMLAWPYGTPRVMSSYDFASPDDGPPGPGDGTTSPVSCGDGWVCEHRFPEIASMVLFRNVTTGTPVTKWWSNGSNAIAFGRGDKGFVVINREDTTLTQTFSTSLPAGTYCDVQRGALKDGACTGPSYVVGTDGAFTATVAPMHALALHVGARV